MKKLIPTWPADTILSPGSAPFKAMQARLTALVTLLDRTDAVTAPGDFLKLAEAARKTLQRRGDGGTGWSMAWKINFWARLQEGDKALELLKNLLKPVVTGGKVDYTGGGTYPNLFCAHPPFQIDGNLGGCAGIAEMLIQSQQGFIEVLPALPAVWKEGSFKGLCVRGGGVVDASWKAGRLEKLTLHSRVKSAFKLKIPEQVKRVEVDRQQHDIQNGFIHLALDEGEQCEIVMKYKL